MSESDWLVVVGDEGSFGGGSGLPVVPDRCGQGQEAGGDAGVESGQGAPAVGCEGELSFEGVEDRFDPWPVAGDLAEPGCLVLAVGTDQMRTELIGDESLEVSAGEALVADDELSGADEVVVAFQ